MTKWNHTIVAAALDIIKERFNPCIWIPGKRGSIQAIRGNRFPATYKPNQDAGAIRSSSMSDLTSSPVQMLPQDYKTASKWKSEQTSVLLDEDGFWLEGAQKSMRAQPLKQVYTYCVTYECRYGCILTTHEAFVFRIKPIAGKKSSNGESSGTAELKKALITDGLMEYVSIPWVNGSKGDPKSYRDLTVNLGLWFIHILAGNGHRVDWEYGELRSEQLIHQPPTTLGTTHMTGDEPGGSDSDQSEGLVTKRGRIENDDDDPIHMSFHSVHQFASKRADSSTDQSVESDPERVGREVGEASRGDLRPSKKRKRP